MKYEAKTFTIPELQGISKDTIEGHLGLYQGYVKHVNLIQENITKLSVDTTTHAYLIGELQRRLGFEFCGMKNHESYFAQFEGGFKALPDGTLKSMIEAQWGRVDTWIESFKLIAKTRGVGWAMLYLDEHSNQLVQTWVDEQHLGQLADTKIVLALDMWEHSYMRDYRASEKATYIEAFFKNLNWEVVSNRIT
jgi:superoxide dismutase, Fe-Mn family